MTYFLADLKSLLVGPRGMALLAALGEPESGEDDVKGVLAEQGRAGEEEAV